MVDVQGLPPSSGLRIPKACENCRIRKIKCNGASPCKLCQSRNTRCTYRNITRKRRKKHEQTHKSPEVPVPSREHSVLRNFPTPSQPSEQRDPSAVYQFHNSVSATHMASPSCKLQLYYGPTSHFSLMQYVYRDFVSTPEGAQSEPRSEVEEAGAGLDLFSFRRIFFGTPIEVHDSPRGPYANDSITMFLPYELAKTFLRRYLSTLHHLMPFWPRELAEQRLEQLYDASISFRTGNLNRLLVLMFLACGALGTEHHRWGDLLLERVKTSFTTLDDVVNLQTVQLSLVMIMVYYAHYQNEQGRPNSAFLHAGASARKALSAGLHKEVPANGEHGDVESTKERRNTFWSLYIYEIWICFHLGRPCSLSLNDIGITQPEDPFLLVLISLTKAISRSANEIHGQRHESLLEMWRIAQSIIDDIQCYDSLMRRLLGYGLDKSPQPGSQGAQQTILTTLYYHTLLLTFRPFLIFRGKLRKLHNDDPTDRQTEIPPWLNEACNIALYTAQKTLCHLYEAYITNELVREIRYHAFFLGSACFSLIYDLLQDKRSTATHLPLIHIGIQCLFMMRSGDPTTSTISAIQIILKKVNPAYVYTPGQQADGGPGSRCDFALPIQEAPIDPAYNHQGNRPPPANMDAEVPEFGPPGLFNINHSFLQDGLRHGNNVMDSNDLLDFTQSDMGWDFDFSTMDLEAFLSINPTMDRQAI